MGAQSFEASCSSIRIVSGMPSAVPVRSPKLERMSLRTTPLWLRTSGPFEPSPGNGPAVSSGITSQAASPTADADGPPPEAVAPAPDVADPEAPLGAQPA